MRNILYNKNKIYKVVFIMTELEKIEYTKDFIDKLASGINPLDDTPIPDGDLLNNVRISRCMFYVSDILKQIINNKGFSKNTSNKNKLSFYITPEILKGFQFSQEPIGITEITKRINLLIDENIMKKLKITSITEWLVDNDILYNETINGKNHKRVTSQGESIGIFEQIYQGQYGEYKKVLYNEHAQHFIIDNIEAIIKKNNT